MNQLYSNSEILSFKTENFETQYAATQLAIWSFTNPNRYTGSREKIITENPLIKELIAIAETHKNDPSQPYEEFLKELSKVSVNLTDIIPTGEEGDYYTFETTIEDDNVGNSFFISNESLSINILVSHPEKVEDISTQTVISLNKEEKNVHFKVPKEIIDENKPDATLLIKAQATVMSKDAFYLTYTAIGTSYYQPSGIRNTI